MEKKFIHRYSLDDFCPYCGSENIEHDKNGYFKKCNDRGGKAKKYTR